MPPPGGAAAATRSSPEARATGWKAPPRTPDFEPASPAPRRAGTAAEEPDILVVDHEMGFLVAIIELLIRRPRKNVVTIHQATSSAIGRPAQFGHTLSAADG